MRRYIPCHPALMRDYLETVLPKLQIFHQDSFQYYRVNILFIINTPRNKVYVGLKKYVIRGFKDSLLGCIYFHAFRICFISPLLTDKSY